VALDTVFSTHQDNMTTTETKVVKAITPQTPMHANTPVITVDTTDMDAKDVKDLVENLKKRKGRPTLKHAQVKRLKRDPRIYVNSGNDTLLRHLGMEVGPASELGKFAEVTLPTDWTYSMGKLGMGDCGVIQDANGDVVCKIVELLTKSYAVVI
jgi:hypothetical protein